MHITVRYFASLREVLGAQESVAVAPGTTLAALREQLAASTPRHADALRRGRALRCAINQVLIADDSAAIPEGAEVAFFPPVTGG
jgi:molybdopterin synthase sulfur carrier subunit